MSHELLFYEAETPTHTFSCGGCLSFAADHLE